MNTILRLPDEVIMQIAAGQVVDRPVSVVKELLENALDAGSTLISIDITGGGYQGITVVDNGKGMHKNDVQICYQPHTTSKIASVDDLIALSTHGFRGEALASIAAVGSLTVASRQANSTRGWKVEIEKGVCVTSEPVGMPPGTRISVSDLFRDMPVRKARKIAITRSSQEIVESVIRLSLLYRLVDFELIQDGKRVLHARAVSDLSERVRHIFGEKYYDNTIPVNHSDTYYSFSGFIGKPVISKSHALSYISVNHRPIHDAALEKNIRDIYGTLIPARYHPFVLLNISVPHEEIDVNIDPQKNRIHLNNAPRLYSVITRHIQNVFNRYNLIPQPIAKPYSIKMDKETQGILNDSIDLWSPEELAKATILQVNQCYLVWEHLKSIYIADQHAVHERILYEHIQKGFYEKVARKSAFKYPQPVVLSLSVSDKSLFEQYISSLETTGFTFRKEDDQWCVEAVPYFLKNRDIDDLLAEILHHMSSERGSEGGTVLDHVTHATITYMACRKAIKAGDFVSEAEARRLIVKLFECKNPYTCPHGRPTVQQISENDLRHMFKRS